MKDTLQIVFKKYLFLLIFLLGGFLFFPVNDLKACHASGFLINNFIDNGNGTYTLDLTVGISGPDNGGWDSTYGFYFSVEPATVNILSATSVVSNPNNGEILTSVISGNTVTYGTPVGSGQTPFNDITDPDALSVVLNISVTVDGLPTSWTGGGQENDQCPSAGTNAFPLFEFDGCLDLSPAPTLTFILVSPADPTTICVGDDVTIGASSSANDDDIVWGVPGWPEGVPPPTGPFLTINDVQPPIGSSSITYSVSASTVTGCITTFDQYTININLPPNINTTDATFCSGEPITFSTETVTVTNNNFNPINWIGPSTVTQAGDFYTVDTQLAPGTHTFNLSVNNGICPADVTDVLVITIEDPIPDFFNDEICYGDFVSVPNSSAVLSPSVDGDVNGNIVTQVSTTNADGCDVLIDVNITENIQVFPMEDYFYCIGDPFPIINGVELFPGPNTVIDFIDDANFCRGEYNYNLVGVSAFLETAPDIQICTGETANWDNDPSIPLSVGLNSVPFVSAEGCDSTYNVTVIELDNITREDTVTVCEGQTPTFDGTNLTVGQNQDFTYTSAAGCDSIVTVFAQENPSVNGPAQNFSVCTGETFDFDGTILNAGDSQDFTYTSSTGCDSIVTVTIGMFPENTPSTIEEEVCPGSSFTFDGVELFGGDSQDFTYADINGCDSTITVNVTQLNNVTGPPVSLTACPSSSATFDGSQVPAGTSEDFTYTSAAGCDSVVTVTVNELNIPQGSGTIQTCTGVPTSFQGTTLNEGDVQDFTLSGAAANGCDSIVTVTVVGLAVVTGPAQTLSACPGASATFDGTQIAAGSSQIFTYTSSLGCDSTVNVSVDILPEPTGAATLQTCTGQAITFQGTSLNGGDVQTFTLTGAASNGCDSLVTITVDEVAVVVGDPVTLTACTGTTAIFDGSNLTPGTTTQFDYISSIGCDSIVMVTVDELLITTGTTTLEACTGETADFNGTSLNAGDSQDFTLVNAVGCDSILTVTVNELTTFTDTNDFDVCQGETFDYNGTTLNGGDVQDFTFTAVNGCDSVVTVTITELPTFTSSTTLQTCENQPIDFNGTTLNGGDVQDFTFTASNGCDSVVTVTVTEVGTITSSETLQACEGQTIVFSGETLSGGDVQDFTFTASNGCDSIVTVTVDEISSFTSTVDLDACEGETVDYEGNPLSPNTTQDFTYVSVIGCDSIVTVNVGEILNILENVDLEVCNGETTTFDGTVLNGGDEQDFTYTSAAGCDSIISVTVSINPTYESDVELQSCQGIAVDFDGTSLNPGDSQTFTYSTVSGCDSIINVTVIEVTTLTATQDITSCGIPVVFDGQSIDVGDSADFTYVSSIGCDSVLTVNAILLPMTSLASSTDVNCFGGDDGTVTVDDIQNGNGDYTYSIDGSNFQSSNTFAGLTEGDYTITIQDGQGCTTTDFATVSAPTSDITASFAETTITITEGESTQLQLNTTGTGSLDLNWNTTAGLSCTDCTSPIASPLATTDYEVSILDENGCSVTANVTVIVEGRPYVLFPSAFSPNGDGTNDVFRPISSGIVTNYLLTVADRWGNVVFQTSDLTQGWDGKFDGTDAEMGVYVFYSTYTLSLENTEQVKSVPGNITLIR